MKMRIALHRGGFVARSQSHGQRQRWRCSSALQHARGLSGKPDEKKEEEINYELAVKQKEKKQKTALPWFASTLVTPQTPVRDVVEGTIKNAEGVLAMIPEEQLKRVVRIYKPAKNAMQSATHKTKPWALEFDNQERWSNSLIGYSSSADPLGATAVRLLKFDTLDEAISFVERQGWSYEVDPEKTELDLEGKKQYAQNFLNYHVANRRSRLKPDEFAKSQFAHPERGKAVILNLKHTPFGEKPSNTVGQTQWSDEHPHDFNPSSWRHDKLRKAQELARKLGK